MINNEVNRGDVYPQTTKASRNRGSLQNSQTMYGGQDSTFYSGQVNLLQNSTITQSFDGKKDNYTTFAETKKSQINKLKNLQNALKG